MNKHSAVSFDRVSRIHLGLAVKDLARSVAFYEALLGQGPSKVRSGYAKFEVDEPRVNLSLNEHSRPGKLELPAHFGIQVKTTQGVAEMARRLEQAGLATRREESVACCFAVQDKAWVADPDGNAWEVFVVLDDGPSQATMSEASAACCGPDCCTK